MYNIESLKTELPYYQEILLHYKVNPCTSNQKNIGELLPINQHCNQMFCFGYHNVNERRRPVFREDSPGMVYQPIKCPRMMENLPCNQVEFCIFAHTQNEINYHPLFYKTEPCHGCSYEANSKFCPHYHSDEISRKFALDKFKAKMNKEVPKTQQNISATNLSLATLDNFKAKACPLKGNHNPKMCEYFHHDQDRKRPVGILHYSPNLCPFNSDEKPCLNGDNCRYAHNKVEQLYHPERYKKKFCLTHPHNVYKCDYGNYCSFAHSENEIQVELLHNLKKDESFYIYKYKTVFCPYIYEHDRNQCVYAHNPQDFRRDPKAFNYEPFQCSHWSQGPIFSYEEGGCPKNMQCEQCHGWKEMEYHPLYYKAKPCNNGKKCNKKDCPFYHNIAERRDIQLSSQLPQNLLGTQGPSNLMPAQKPTAFLENEYSLNFDIPTSKFGKPKESRYQRPIPIIPNYAAFPKFDPQQEISQAKQKYQGEASTRPNSNISSAPFTQEENPQQQERFKKRKTKGISLQTQTERLTSPQSAKSDKPTALKQAFLNQQDWEPLKQEEKSIFNEFFLTLESKQPLGESKANDSFESLRSYNLEKNIVVSDKPNEATNSQFLKTLYNNLERKGLDYTIQHFKNSNVEVEVLKSFNQKNFHLFPQISVEDKERIVKIVQDIVEGDAILSEINTIHDEPFGETSSVQPNSEEAGIFANFGGYENTDFNPSSFFQRYTY